jgi:CRISPR/Cas system-associated exonuclease Cas4 (RecB family)
MQSDQFNYPELKTVEIDGLRLYKTPNDDYYPSITTVLGRTASKEKQMSLANWRNSIGHEEADRITNEAAQNGTAVHLMIERFLKEEDPFQDDSFAEKAIGNFHCLKPKLRKIQEVVALEVPLFSDELQVAGRTDCIGVINNKLQIIDFKTSSKIKAASDIHDYCLQLSAYAIMHNEKQGTNIHHGTILMASDGFPQEFEFDLTPFRASLINRINEFYQKLN